MSRVIHFEIPAGDPRRAMEFYAKTFGWTFERWGEAPYWMASTGAKDAPGIDGAVMPREHAAQTVNNVLHVDSLEAAMEAVKSNGGELLTPVIPIPGIGRYANARDTEGNSFGMMQPGDPV